MDMKIIGLTGTLGSGKTAVASMLRDKGACVVDMDAAGKWAVEENEEVQRRLRKAFGDAIYDEKNTLKRRTLGEIVFANADALKTLNVIVHPVMLQRARQLITNAQQDSSCRYVVVDAALLLELEFHNECDVVVTVSAPLEECLERAQASKGLSREQALQRMQSQLPQDAKVRRADYVIKKDSTLQSLGTRVDELHRWLLTL